MGTAQNGEKDQKPPFWDGMIQIHDWQKMYLWQMSGDGFFLSVNPSLTYMALTARAADFAGSELKN